MSDLPETINFMSSVYMARTTGLSRVVVVTVRGAWIGRLDLLHLYTELVTTRNYNATADLVTFLLTYLLTELSPS
jgi:hypothetical protein